MEIDKKNQVRSTVLIVDDEYNIGILIEKLIHWDDLQMECIGKATDGESAFQMIRDLQPDIVITDVRMPKISGLDLIRMVQDKAEVVPKFIIVSGYKEFEYAHKAIVYGVENYILKPVNEEELNQTLEKIRKKIDKQFDFRKKEAFIRQSERENADRIKQDFLKNIIEQETFPPEEQEKLAMTGDRYIGIDIKVDYTNDRQYNAKQDELLIRQVKQITEEELSKTADELLICEKENLHVYCLINYQNQQYAEVMAGINKVLSRLQAYLPGYEQYVVTIGIGNPRTDFADIRYSILEASKAICERIRCGTGRLIVYSEKTGSAEKSMLCYRTCRKEILRAVENMSFDTLRENLEILFRQAEQDEALEMFHLYEWAEKLTDACFSSLEYDEEKKDQAKKQLKAKIRHCCKTAQLISVLHTGLERFVKNAREELQSKNTLPIRKAIEYIAQYYRDKILLEDMAVLVNLNPVYFSTLFKKETGMNFSSYLIEVRMEKAKKLLAATNETVSAIGDSVGYADQKYFSQLFKKTVGVKPMVYRKIHS